MAELSGFHDVLFPLKISFGATGGPRRRNEIVTLTSGREQRNARFAHSRRAYDVGTGLRSLEDLHELTEFYEARRGSLHAFRFRDPFDMKSCRPSDTVSAEDQTIGTGDGSTASFALAKTYGVGADAYRRPIGKPVAGSVRVAVDSVELAEGSQFTVDAASGTVTFLAGSVPGSGAVITAGFLFDVPVRFDGEELSISLAAF
ncbi:DUF2460 domain-containing protein [Mesorhizobium xinjiangense]|uniref:DUF2460 domain-containing protein n=1 Tax=Mesorhizobium xinjiangense TaxID=2678685 RepID=UPI0012EEDF66|nr:DUF2460 domain-containing protein [Mesorhizobium xinjiangense]